MPLGGCDGGRVTAGLNTRTGNVLISYDDPVKTRGLPLANRIHINSQETYGGRPMANAKFTYDINVASINLPNKGFELIPTRVVIDADGQLQRPKNPRRTAPTVVLLRRRVYPRHPVPM
jgi:hypothetical protein